MMLTTPFPICMDSSSGKDSWTSSSQMLLQAQRAGFDLQMEGQSRESMLSAMSSACLQQEQSHHHERRLMKPQPPPSDEALKCPRCESMNTKFCYYNNYSLSQPRYFCKTCRRYWTKGGTLRTVPVGGGCRKSKKQKKTHPQSPSSTTTNNLPQQDHQVSLPFPFNSSMLSPQMMSFEGHGVPQITSMPDTGMLTPYSKVNEFLMASIKPNKVNNGSGSSALDLQLLLSPFAGLPPLNSTKTAPSSFASLLDFPKMEEESLHINSHTNLFGENNGYWSSSNNTIPSSSSTGAPSSH